VGLGRGDCGVGGWVVWFTDLPDLIDAAVRAPGSVVVASRARRSEGRLFATFYVLFKALFRVLTGHVISFGNYCVIPCHLLEAIELGPCAGIARSMRHQIRFDQPIGDRLADYGVAFPREVRISYQPAGCYIPL
jgi:hypothetical protein